MIIFIYILVVRTCTVLNEDYYLYPTKDEILEITMDKLIQGNNLIYKCSDCPQDIRIVNTLNDRKIIQNNYTFKSVTYFTDQIYALTTEPSLNIYLKANGSLTLQNVISIDENMLCFSVTQIGVNNIILDCYQNETLILYSVKNEILIQIYTSNSSIPNQTKLSCIINKTNVYFVYGQFFNQLNQTILNLTILYEQKRNSLIYTYSQQDLAYNFVVSQRESTNQTIFIQLLNEIKTYVLSQLGTLVQANNIILNQNIISMAYYYSYDEYYQFDRIFLIVLDDDQDYMYFIDIFYSDSLYVQLLESKQLIKTINRNAQLFISQQLIVIYDDNQISIMNNERFNQIMIRNFDLYQTNSVVYFDGFTQELFIFGQYIEIYTLLVPTLIFASDESNGSFSIQAYEIDGNFHIRKCQTLIHYLQVSKQDNNVYFIYEQPQQSYFNLLQFPFISWINFVSGPLVKVSTIVSNPNLGNFNDATLTKLNQTLQSNQNYYMVKLFSVNLFQECKSTSFNCYFIIAVNNQNLDIYQEGTLLPVSSTGISYINNTVTQIEITFVVLNEQLFYLVCLSFSQNIIQLYQLNSQLQLINNTNFSTASFKQFQLLSNAVVLLLDTNQIVITTFDNQSKILLDEQILKETFGSKIDFNPTSIFINQQYQSRILYINNQNSFIIGQITDQLIFVLISIKKVIFLIENLQVVNNLLILSYIHQDMTIIQFEVWNVKNLKYPKFQRSMRQLMLELDKGSISYQSDNSFFYVQIGQIVNVFNPTLSEHSSLYYRFQMDTLNFTSIVTDSMTLIYFNQSLFLFSPVLLQTFYNESIHSDFLSEQIFNLTICSYLNEQRKINSFNSSVTIINNYQQIEMNTTNLSVSQSQSYVELFRNNISFEGQVLQFELSKKSKNLNNYTLTNFIEYFNLTNDQSIYNLIIQYNNGYNNQFLLMNNYSILNYKNKDKYYFGPYKQCIASTAYNFNIYALCQDNQQYNYIISMNLSNAINNFNLDSKVILNLTNLSYINTSWIRIQNNLLYIWNNTILMYSINQVEQQYGQSDLAQFICKSTQFGFQSIQIEENDGSQIIIYFYFKPIHKDQLYYKFARYRQNQTLDHSDENSFLFKTITQQYLSFDTIPMIYQKKKEIYIMISNSNFILTVSFLLVINKQHLKDSQLIFQNFIQTSPPFDKHYFTVSQQPQYDQGLLLFMYSKTLDISNQTYMITFYNISNNQNVNFLTPLFFQGGYNFTLNYTLLSAFSFIAQNNSFGQILILFNNGNILELRLNIFSINITLSPQKEKFDQYELYAQNYYNSTVANINLVFIKQHLFETTSFYILFGITVIVLLTSFLLYNVYQKRNEDDEDNSEDEEDEL